MRLLPPMIPSGNEQPGELDRPYETAIPMQDRALARRIVLGGGTDLHHLHLSLLPADKGN